jgi:hypothetical protein
MRLSLKFPTGFFLALPADRQVFLMFSGGIFERSFISVDAVGFAGNSLR